MVYIPQLGGKIDRERYEDLQKASDFIGEENIFATYASAQEVMRNSFQPSGTDYIIHVLGDSQREAYLDSFAKGGFRYAVTMREDFAMWEYWVQRANWFFYRELYKNWHKVFSNSYAYYWERNPNHNNAVETGINLSVFRPNESEVLLQIRTDENVNGTADVLIDYAVRKKDTLRAKLAFRPMLRVEERSIEVDEKLSRFKANSLRRQSREYVPVLIADGYGELLLRSCPSEDTYLELYDASCSAVYPEMLR